MLNTLHPCQFERQPKFQPERQSESLFPPLTVCGIRVASRAGAAVDFQAHFRSHGSVKTKLPPMQLEGRNALGNPS